MLNDQEASMIIDIALKQYEPLAIGKAKEYLCRTCPNRHTCETSCLKYWEYVHATQLYVVYHPLTSMSGTN